MPNFPFLKNLGTLHKNEIQFNSRSQDYALQTRDSIVSKWPGTHLSPTASMNVLCARWACSGSEGLYRVLQGTPYVNFEILPVTKRSTKYETAPMATALFLCSKALLYLNLTTGRDHSRMHIRRSAKLKAEAREPLLELFR